MRAAAASVMRVARAWRALSGDHRLAASAAVLLCLTLFLPWYQETVVSARRATSTSVSGWGAFSLVEAIVLLVGFGVLALLLRRGEDHVWRLPDGVAIVAAGALTSLLVVWRMFDKQTVEVRGPGTAISGIEWGIFVALASTLCLLYAGNRIRAGQMAQSDEQPTGSFEPAGLPRRQPARRTSQRRYGTSDQMTIPLEEEANRSRIKPGG